MTCDYLEQIWAMSQTGDAFQPQDDDDNNNNKSKKTSKEKREKNNSMKKEGNDAGLSSSFSSSSPSSRPLHDTGPRDGVAMMKSIRWRRGALLCSAPDKLEDFFSCSRNRTLSSSFKSC